MRLALPLVVLSARRCLSPAGLLLLALALSMALVLPWSPSAERGAGELSREIGAGLARQGIWLCGIAFAWMWFCARAANSVRQWRRGESAWLGTCEPSRASIAWAHALGAGLALGVALMPFAVAAEWRAGDSSPSLRWLSESRVRPIALLTEDQAETLSVHPPEHAKVVLARFVIAAPGSGGLRALVRCTIERAGARPVSSETAVTSNAPIALELPDGAGLARLRFERVGPGAVVALEGPRLQWFAPRGTRGSVEFAMLLHAWLALLAAAALALGVGAWTSPGSAFFSAFALLAIPWIEERLPPAWPGAGLRDALELAGAGFGPGNPDPATWIGCAAVVLVAPLLAAAHPDLWRREV